MPAERAATETRWQLMRKFAAIDASTFMGRSFSDRLMSVLSHLACIDRSTRAVGINVMIRACMPFVAHQLPRVNLASEFAGGVGMWFANAIQSNNAAKQAQEAYDRIKNIHEQLSILCQQLEFAAIDDRDRLISEYDEKFREWNQDMKKWLEATRQHIAIVCAGSRSVN